MRDLKPEPVAMSRIYEPSEFVISKSRLPSFERYKEIHKSSIDDPEAFWNNIASEFFWHSKYETGKFFDYNFDITKGKIFLKWMEGAVTNVCFNVLDRHVRNGHGDKVAYYWYEVKRTYVRERSVLSLKGHRMWSKLQSELSDKLREEGNQPDDYSRCTYRKLLDLVCQFANGLRDCGVGRGDRVGVYMPMILETVVCMLACARIGAVHTVVFAGFSSDSLAERLADSQATMVVTVDGAWRGEKMLYLKNTVDEAIRKARVNFNHYVNLCICVAHLARVTPGADQAPDECPYSWDEEHDIWWHELMDNQSTICPPAWMGAEDPLFMLYTSGSTGKPKGVVHTTAGYMLYAAATFRYVFDYRDRDVYWCTADVGWITGHTYVVYAPLANAATSVLFEGTPFFPDADRYWEIINKYKVSQFYTAPTAIRSLMKFGEGFTQRHDLESLRVLGSVGEPINPEAWHWYYQNVGGSRASIVDTFWQTETGGHVLTSFPGATPMKPGAAGFPFFGVEPVLLDEAGQVIEGPGEGYLVFSRPWPGMMRTLYGDHERFEKVYFSKFPGYYCTGDGARRDEDGLLWVTGRIDDMLNVSGHLMSTAEVEGVLTEHPQVNEAAVVARPHPVKGESLYCFVTLAEGFEFSDSLVDSLKKLVRRKIGAFAAPDVIQYAPGLPKTRSGKIMRRILRKIALGDRIIGDTSTLADPGVIEELFRNRPT